MTFDSLKADGACQGNLTGRLNAGKQLAGWVGLAQSIEGRVSMAKEMTMEPYDGPYQVTPAVEAQTLATKNKYMTEDVAVMSIPYFDVSNPSGGSTVYIGTCERS